MFYNWKENNLFIISLGYSCCALISSFKQAVCGRHPGWWCKCCNQNNGQLGLCDLFHYCQAPPQKKKTHKQTKQTKNPKQNKSHKQKSQKKRENNHHQKKPEINHKKAQNKKPQANKTPPQNKQRKNKPTQQKPHSNFNLHLFLKIVKDLPEFYEDI